jgi:hypothetical protein
MAGAFNRPDTGGVLLLLSESKRLRVAAAVARHRPLRQHRSGRRLDESERVLVSVRVDADHVVHHLCNHPIDPPASVRRVR